MSQAKSQLDSDDSSNLGNARTNNVKGACSRLRRRAFKTASQLSLANKSTIRSAAKRVIKDLARCTNAADVHLFRITVDETGAGQVGLRYHTESLISAPAAQSLHKFQFRLLPPRVQECIKANQIAKLSGNSERAGRILSEVLSEVDCKTYYLCPLFIDGRVRGLLGVACQQELSAQDENFDEFFELLKLNATILLTNIMRVRRESRRAKKLTEWRRIADQACDFAITLGDQLVINKTAAFGAGEATPNLDGLRLTDIVLRSFHRDLIKQIATAVETSQVRTTNFQIALGHQGPRWCLARIEPSRSTNTGCATLYLTDNNQDQLLQQEVRELTDHLVKASRLSLLGQMSTEFSHQLNQPLQAILNYCNMMQRKIDRGTATEEHSVAALANIENSVLHSSKIIQRIRDFVKFRTLLTENMSLREIIEQAMMLVIPTARGWNADITPPVDMLDLEVVVDKAQTTHVLVNLMINALEACREFGVDRPHIELFVREESHHGRVTVGVRDNGPGLPLENPSVVFQKFYSGKEEGLGMGLAISREVCESQGGSLTAENNVGRNGCTFFVSMELNNTSGSDTAELDMIAPDDEPSTH